MSPAPRYPSRKRRCIGFGERDCRKADPVKHCTNVADTLAGLWCQECAAERRRSVSAQMASITRIFEEDRADPSRERTDG